MVVVGVGHRAAGATVASRPRGRQFGSSTPARHPSWAAAAAAAATAARRWWWWRRGGNWSDRTLFTQFAVQMKSVLPKHGVTEGGGGAQTPPPSMTRLLI